MEDEGHRRSLHPNTTQRSAPPIELCIRCPFCFALPRNNSSTEESKLSLGSPLSLGRTSPAEAVN